MAQAQTNSTEQGGIFNTLRNRWETKVVAPAVIVMGAVGLASCAGQGEVGAAPTPDQTVSAPATEKPTPSASATPTVESTPKTEPLTGELPENLKPYESISLEEFAALDKDAVQLPYFAALAGGIDGIRRFAMSYAGQSQNPGDTLPKEISENNSAEEIGAILAYGRRMLMGLEPEDRLKAAVAILEGGLNSPHWSGLESTLSQNAEYDAMPGSMVARYNFSVLPEIESAGELITDSVTGQAYRDLVVIGPNGDEQQGRAYYHSVTVGDQTFNWWTER